jgi:hypothetical protein
MPVKQSWPIIGRDTELAVIADRLRRGRGTVVVGEAGLGTSVLVGEKPRRLLAHGRPPPGERRRSATRHHQEAGQREQRHGGTGGAARRVEVTVGEREHRRGDQQVSHDDRQLADEQRGNGGERAEPGPPVSAHATPQR